MLSRHFTVVSTPEHYTSKTCMYCSGACGPFEELERQRHEKLKEEAEKVTKKKKEKTKNKASRRTIRSLRRCTNESCQAVLCRDGNAATMIGRRLQNELQQGNASSVHLDEVDAYLDNSNVWLHQSS